MLQPCLNIKIYPTGILYYCTDPMEKTSVTVSESKTNQPGLKVLLQ